VSRVRENQRCNSGALADRTRNGGPTVKSKVFRSHHAGLPPSGAPAAVAASIAGGSATAATTSSPTCTSACARAESQRVSASA
jgi:hypothetical protein